MLSALKKSQMPNQTQANEQEKKGQNDLMKSSVHQDLKASMFQDVFGYEQKQEKTTQPVFEESKDGVPLQVQNAPIVATAGIESSLNLGYEQA